VVFKGGTKENRIYIVIAIIIVIVIILTVFFSTNQLVIAYIEDDVLGTSWIEDIRERDSGSQLLGLEKWASYTYRINDSHPAYITVTSFKTLLMMSEDDLKSKTIDTILSASDQGIVIDEETKIEGERTISQNHKTMYIIYDGNDTSDDTIEQIKIIGETWNCGNSGTSIICIGVAQITDNAHGNSNQNYSHWAEIIKDNQRTFGSDIYYDAEGGLIFNVKCH
jgi:hypothetical protein